MPRRHLSLRSLTLPACALLLSACLLALSACATYGQRPSGTHASGVSDSATLAGPRFDRFVDSSGRSGEYGLWEAPATAGAKRGALVFFHADAAGPTYAEWLSPELQALAQRHGLVLVSMQEPERGCWWAPHAFSDTKYVLEFLERALIEERGVDRARVYFAGKSGGAFFAAGLPAHAGYSFGGGIIGLCGADIPRLDGGRCSDDTDAPEAPMPPLPAGHPALRFWLASTSGDPYRQYSQRAAALYAGLGFPVVERDMGTSGHCEFDLSGELVKAIDELDR